MLQLNGTEELLFINYPGNSHLLRIKMFNNKQRCVIIQYVIVFDQSHAKCHSHRNFVGSLRIAFVELRLS